MTYEPNDRVVVSLPAGEVPGVVHSTYRPGFYLVHIDHPDLASVVVGPHRLRPRADPDRVVPADEG